MSDLYFDVATLNGVAAALPEPKTGLLDRHFTREVLSDRQEISFDVEGSDLKLAPFVHPGAPGQNVVGEGFQVKTFRPAYTKDRNPFTPGGQLTRRIGEAIGGTMSATDRLAAAIADEISKKKARHARRLEWMAAQALVAGKVTVAGDYYPAVVVDFGRDPANTIVKAGASKWGQAGVSPVADLATWGNSMESPVKEWNMTQDAFALLSQDPAFEKRMDTNRRGSNTISSDIPGAKFAAVYVGDLDGVAVYVLPKQTYTDSDGTTKQMVPNMTVIGIGTGFEGVRHFGAIQDIEAMEGGMVQSSLYIKSWIEKDPSARIVLAQSAPLMVPYRPNSTLVASV
ncbi:major capsid protein [Ottowia sp. GY511]|uniref:Major capsid protein n=1 Tax=Ottowia flava TaxID=2675430 RepID=A0ABW4KR81_9BURK|nr:major capsid protein [Ottowia sp. GY511]TXK26499.1 major capsid protein [Ottowia sp. GY511]